jgi:hypothetical protein
MAKSRVTTPSPKTGTAKKTKNTFLVFKKQNYMLLIASVVTLVIGFIVMGSGKDKPFDDPMKITIAPLIVLLGFAIGVVSILYTPKSKEEDKTEE